MKLKLAPFMFGPLLLCLPSCSPPPPRDVVVEIPCEAFAAASGDPVRVVRAVALNDGDNLVLRLCSNPGTGFAWEEARISNAEVLKELAREFIPPAVAMPGAAGMEQLKFVTKARGSCSIELSYSRPWASDGRGVWFFELNVTVG